MLSFFVLHRYFFKNNPLRNRLYRIFASPLWNHRTPTSSKKDGRSDSGRSSNSGVHARVDPHGLADHRASHGCRLWILRCCGQCDRSGRFCGGGFVCHDDVFKARTKNNEQTAETPKSSKKKPQRTTKTKNPQTAEKTPSTRTYCRNQPMILPPKKNWVLVSNIFLFSPPIWGRWTHFDSYFSNGLVQPPTRKKNQPWFFPKKKLPSAIFVFGEASTSLTWI